MYTFQLTAAGCRGTLITQVSLPALVALTLSRSGAGTSNWMAAGCRSALITQVSSPALVALTLSRSGAGTSNWMAAGCRGAPITQVSSPALVALTLSWSGAGTPNRMAPRHTYCWRDIKLPSDLISSNLAKVDILNEVVIGPAGSRAMS